MSHVDDGQLNALLDGELTAAESRAVEAHVAACAECARRLSEARAFLAEAGQLLAVLTPPAVSGQSTAAQRAEPPLVAPLEPGAAAAEAARRSDAGSKPRIAKTAKEVAVSLDGRTELTPAIRPVFPHEVPPQKRRWPLPDIEKLAWAASLILAVGVGYLANEVYHQRRVAELTRTDVSSSLTTDSNAALAEDERSAKALRSEAPVAAPAADRTGSQRGAAGGAGAPSRVGTAGQRGTAEPPKPRPDSKPAPAFARPQAEELAASAPAEGRRNETAQPPAPAPGAPVTGNMPTAVAESPASRDSREQAPANPRALGDVAGAAAPPRQADDARLRAAAPAAPTGAAQGERDAMMRQFNPPAFRVIQLEEAVRRLAGSIRLIDGMNPSRVEAGPGRLVPGADPERDVVRITYVEGGNQFMLDQQAGDREAASFNGLMAGDTLVTTSETGTTQVRWINRKFWLSLSGSAPAETLRGLVERVR